MKIKDICESTCAGGIAPVAMPMTTQKRTKESVDVNGLQPAEKVMKGKAKKKGPYMNSISESKKVSEAHLDEEDVIMIPGQGRSMKTGFVAHDPDRAEHEGETLKNSLRTIVRLSSELEKRLSDKDQFPEWVSEKVGGIKAMMTSVMQYLASQQDAGKPFETKKIPNGGTIAGGIAAENKNNLRKRNDSKKNTLGLQWGDIPTEIANMDKKINFYESYVVNDGKLFETNETSNLDAFDKLNDLAEANPTVGNKYLIIGLYLLNDQLEISQYPEMCELLSKTSNSFKVKLGNDNRVVEFPSKTMSKVMPVVTLLFKNVGDYDKMRSYVSIKFDGDSLPAFTNDVVEGAKVDRMAKHIAKSEREAGKSKDKAENIAWATLNKRGMLNNKNHKKGK